MKKTTSFLRTTIAVLCFTGVLSGCEEKNSAPEPKTESTQQVSQENSSAENSENEYFSEFDLETDYKDVTASIELNGNDVSIEGDGAEFKDKKLAIQKGGTYLLSGDLSDGQIYVNCSDDYNVHIVLNGVNVSNSDGSPFYIENAKNTAVTLADGTKNTFSDGKTYSGLTEEDEPYAAIFSCDDLSFNGNGYLEVTANYNEGIAVKNDLRIAGGSYTVNSVGSGIKGKDSVVIRDADIKIISGKDGIKSTETDDTEKGYIVFESGNYDITAAFDAVQAESMLTINDGTYNLMTGEGAKEVQTAEINRGEVPDMKGGEKPELPDEKSENFPEGEFDPEDMPEPGEGFEGAPGGHGDIPAPPDGENSDEAFPFKKDGGMEGGRGGMMMEGNSNKPEESEKGLKSGGTLTINGGTITADCADDGIHSGGNISINGGTVSVKSGDDGIHSDSDIEINDGKIDVAMSYEGVEAVVINVNGGDINVKSSDDGFNASEGTTDIASEQVTGENSETENTEAFADRMMKNHGGMMGGVSEKCKININGGNIYVDGGGDGLDSNGSMTFSGGVTIVDGPTNSGNTALDTGTEIIINGGTVIASGSSGMVELPSDESEQASICTSFSESQNKDIAFTVTDKEGKIIASYKPSKQYECVIISTPDIKVGEEYSVYTGGEISGASEGSIIQSGSLSGGTAVDSKKLSEMVTSFGNGTLGQMNHNGGRETGRSGIKPVSLSENGEDI